MLPVKPSTGERFKKMKEKDRDRSIVENENDVSNVSHYHEVDSVFREVCII